MYVEKIDTFYKDETMVHVEHALLTVLENLGLEKKAATIYLSLLAKRKMTISEIARDSGIKRATCYEYVNSLLRKNFITRVPVGRRTFYASVEPKRILADFKRRTELFGKKVQDMENMRASAVNKPRVTFYEGKREIKNIYDDVFKTVGDVYSIFPAATFFQNFTEEDYNEFDKAISQYALKSRDLFVKDKYYKKIKEIRDKNGSANKLDKKLPDDFENSVDVIIYGEKVALISLRDLSAIVIENKNIADLFRTIHNFIWKAV